MSQRAIAFASLLIEYKWLNAHGVTSALTSVRIQKELRLLAVGSIRALTSAGIWIPDIIWVRAILYRAGLA